MLGASFSEDRNSQLPKLQVSLKNWANGKSPPPKKIISVTFSGGLLSTIGDVGLGLALHGPVLSFIHEFKMTLHTQAQIEGKNLILHLSKYNSLNDRGNNVFPNLRPIL